MSVLTTSFQRAYDASRSFFSSLLASHELAGGRSVFGICFCDIRRRGIISHRILPCFVTNVMGAVPFVVFTKGTGSDSRYEKQARAAVRFQSFAFHYVQLLSADAAARLK